MNNKKQIAVIGCGGVGGYYGSQLQKQGHDVHYLLNSDYEHVKDNGLSILSPNGNYDLDEVYAYNNVNDMPPCDIVLLGLKTTSNHLLEELLPPVTKKDGFVFALQNGIGIEEQVAEVVGADRVIGGLCFICSVKQGPGLIEHQDYGWISVGDYREDGEPAGITPRIQMIADLFEGSDVVIELMKDLTQARWQKLIFNIPFNGLSVVLDANTREMTRDEHIRSLAWELMLEVGIATQAAVNREIPQDFMQSILDKTTAMLAFEPSMKQDHDAGRPLEVETIHGEVVRRANAAGVRVPHIEMLYQQLKYIDHITQTCHLTK